MTQIQKKYKNTVKVEASTTRSTNTTNFVVKGTSEANVKAARKELTVALAKRVTLEVMIPQSLRAFVIGAKGKNLKNIVEQTNCRVNIARQEETAADEGSKAVGGNRDEVDYDNDEQVPVVIEGDEVNAQQAARMVQELVSERTSRTTQRLTTIDHIFYPFVAGAKGSNAARLESQVGRGDVSVRVPPRAAFLHPAAAAEEDEAHADTPRRERDLAIVVTGDREQVQAVVQAIEAQVEDMKRSFRSLVIQVPKRQHRFLVGDAANEILATSQCSVELAPVDDPSDEVTIRGPQTQLPAALSAVMEKANAVKVEVIDLLAAHRSAPNPLQHAKNLLRWLIARGKLPKKQGVQVYPPRSALIESTGTVQLEVVGAEQADVAEVRTAIDRLVKSTPPSYVDSIDIDPLLHAMLIGKKGANAKEHEKKGVETVFPPTASAEGEGRSDILLVFVPATPAADAKARDAEARRAIEEVKNDLLKSSVQAADLKTETLKVLSKYHRSIVGPGGSTLNAVLGEERTVAVRVGNAKGQTGAEDTITVRGPSAEVDRVVAALRKIAKDAEEDAIVNGIEASLSVDSNHVKHLVGKSGAAITKLREELGVRIDFDDDAASGTSKKSKVTCKITGRKENVEEARKRLAAQEEKLADEREEVLKIAPNLHSAIIGKGGVWVLRLQENHGVRIEFPRQGEAAEGSTRRAQKPDEVIVRGGKKGVAAAKSEIMELLEYEKENNNILEFEVGTTSLARILGKSGATVNQIRDDTGAQIDVTDSAGSNTSLIRLRGTKKAIADAKAAISAIDNEVKGEDSFTLTIPSKFHGQLIGPGGQNLRDIVSRATDSTADARSTSQLVQFPRRGDKDADTVIVRGPAATAKKIKTELEAAAKIFMDRICHGVAAVPDQQRQLIGRGGSRRAELEAQYNVRLLFPGRHEHTNQDIDNAAEVANAPAEHIVKILGNPEEVERAKKEIMASSATTRQVQVPQAAHSKLANGQFFSHLRSQFGVNVDAPPRGAGQSKSKGTTVSSSAGAAATARIDDEDDVEEGAIDEALPFELIKLDAADSSATVKWTLSAKGEADKANNSLAKAEEHIKSSIAEAAASSTHEGRLTVPESAIPRIIGKKGSGLQSIETEIPGVSVEVPKESKGLCIIRGSEAAVLEAKARITKTALTRREY